MHHPGLLLLLLLVALLIGPLIMQGLTALSALVVPLFGAAPGALFFSRIAAPAALVVVLGLGVLVVGAMKLLLGV